MSVLLDRSLLIGSMVTGIMVHDLVLAFMRAQFAPTELRDGHRRVVAFFCSDGSDDGQGSIRPEVGWEAFASADASKGASAGTTAQGGRVDACVRERPG